MFRQPSWPSALVGLLVVMLATLGGCGGEAPTSELHTTDLSPDVAFDTVEGDATVELDTSTGAPDLVEDTAPDVSVDVAIDVPEAPPRAASLETVVTPNPVTAGEPVTVHCQLYDESGQLFVDPEATLPQGSLVPEDSFARDDAQQLIALRAGDARATCSHAGFGLIDPTPAELEIVPGPVHTVVTVLDATRIVAGESVAASCALYDAFGNAIDAATLDGAVSLVLDQVGDGIEVEGLDARVTRAGIYHASCHVDGAVVELGMLLEVVPSLPAAMVVARVPDQTVYGLGQIVSFETRVLDIFDNVVPDAGLAFDSAPAAQPFGAGRFRFNAEGTYLITASVTSPTLDDLPVSAQTTVVVNGTGPQIACGSPLDGAMVNRSPGSTLTFTGTVNDPNGVASVVVNGQPVNVGADGTFSRSLTVRYGINFVDIVAVDGFGEENSTTCAFLAADTWAGETAYIGNAVSLKMRPSAIDDANRADALDSLADILHAVLNSTGLRTTLHNALLAANPLKPMSCDQNVCVFGGCVCLFESKVTYLSSTINGPNTASLSLVSGGISASMTVRNIGARVRVDGTVDTTGWAYVDYVTVNLIFDLTMVSNKPRITVRSGSVSATVGSVDLEFPGFTGLIIDIIQSLFQNQIRYLIRDTIRGYIANNFDDLLDGVIGGLDIASLGSSFNVPRLDGNGAIALGFAVNYSSVAVSSARALFGIGTRFTGPTAHGRASLGVPLLPGSSLHDASGSTAVSLAVYGGVLNQALHALWRGGLFHASLDSGDLGGVLPSGATANIETLLPPVTQIISASEARVMLGAMRLRLVLPGIFDEPLEVVLGATARASISLVGSDLRFGNIVLQELYVATPGISLPDATRSTLESFVRSLLQGIINSSLNDALPALPIPSFQLPQSLATFGLPAGRRLGLLAPTLSSADRHFLLHGNFGLLP